MQNTKDGKPVGADAEVEFWEDIDARLEDLRLKAATMVELILAKGDYNYASDIGFIAQQMITFRGRTATRIRNAKQGVPIVPDVRDWAEKVDEAADITIRNAPRAEETE